MNQTYTNILADSYYKSARLVNLSIFQLGVFKYFPPGRLQVLSHLPSASEILRVIGASAAQLCFFTLTLRHTRQLADVKTAQRLLQDSVCDVVSGEIPDFLWGFIVPAGKIMELNPNGGFFSKPQLITGG